jgi:hypothetical protein
VSKEKLQEENQHVDDCKEKDRNVHSEDAGTRSNGEGEQIYARKEHLFQLITWSNFQLFFILFLFFLISKNHNTHRELPLVQDNLYYGNDKIEELIFSTSLIKF